MKNTRFLIVLLALLVSNAVLLAQSRRTITGVIKNEEGQPVPSATVTVKGTGQSAVTDESGQYSIAVDNDNAVLVFSSVGFSALEMRVGNLSVLNTVLSSSATNLGEVVVTTALGIKRQKKSLGYAVQEVKGTTLADAREPNLTNALTGVVAGLQVIRSSNGPAGSSKIILRGSNSLTGDNQPLIVVDGIPVSNFTGASNNDYWNPSLDMGNGLADLNADDIESISVLKGASAAALYGTRAGNGVIMITTKTGRKQKGLGIALSSTLGFENVFTKPALQNVFSQGTDGSFDPIAGSNWGAKIEGQQITNWNGETENLKAYDNINNFYNKGFTQNHSLSLQQLLGSTSIYTSFNRFEDKSMIPGAKLSRTNLTARAISKLGQKERWTVDTKVQYSNVKANNRPLAGNNVNNAALMLYSFPRGVDITRFKAGADEYGTMTWYNTQGNAVNPYWASKYYLNEDSRDRFIMSAALKYKFTEWLDAEIRAGGDLYTNNSVSKTYSGSPLTATGRFALGKGTFLETNYSAMITATKDNLLGKLNGNVMIGGNLMKSKNTSLSGNAGELKVPNLFSLGNSANTPSVREDYSERRINSLYGSVGLNWDEYLYLDITLRNDWSSSLHPDNWSFFYPSLNLSYVVTDMLQKMSVDYPSWISYAKLRASLARAGNDMGPYQLYNIYNIGSASNGSTTAESNNILFDETVRSELIKSNEFGAELRFLKNRVGIDLSFYKSNALHQLINLEMDPLSGYSSRKINAGDIENKGFELMADARILQQANGFNWSISANYSRNRNRVNDILKSEGVVKYGLGGYENLQVLAVAGELYGEIYGSTFLRVTDKTSPYYGSLILNGNGLPQAGEQNVRLGNQQAKGLVGVTNTFGYKGMTFSFLIDARIGGQMFSATSAYLQRNGSAAATVVNGERADFVVDGVVVDGNGIISKNTKAVSPQQYWNQVTSVGNVNLGMSELNLYSASNVRLRNVQIGYDLPASLLRKTPIQKAKIGVSCNNVWLIKSHMNGIDPESVFATGTNATGFENGSPPTNRTFLINLSLNF